MYRLWHSDKVSHLTADGKFFYYLFTAVLYQTTNWWNQMIVNRLTKINDTLNSTFLTQLWNSNRLFFFDFVLR